MLIRLSPLCRLQVGMILFVACLMVTRLAVADETRPMRVVTLGGSVTEIAYALGQEDRLIARDTTSIYPAAVHNLPDVGYVRALSPEGVLSVSPDLIIAIEGAGPPEAIEVLQSAGVTFVSVPNAFSGQGIGAKIRAVGEALGEGEAAEALARKTESAIETATMDAATVADAESKRVLFILSTRGGRIMASGRNTAADSIIKMAGAVNVVTEFEGYKPLTNEAVIGMSPDVILMMDRGGDHALMDDELFAMPALSVTPAARDRAVVRMNGMFLLGFGPRTMSAVADLSAALYSGS
jgi:heme transport system substrate-binding protein